ncbi:uncharacterized protein LAESUDRAFT_463447 [Laetiporus sulphureus 93-53]|uniref:Uncharacterized protein n=1 Tax=Laetiporus sulphureus 93-53 TaxID=1314785 RepID=A0A165G624_9APHY|nr:uncharacterized protein LAESUDRAFT_463447 [Laetiporus sulphureus 93-53]KZT09875.1 hypothetical protein LAESUDRAFT_463447 [Laetiporus sulphureus 93-53]
MCIRCKLVHGRARSMRGSESGDITRLRCTSDVARVRIRIRRAVVVVAYSMPCAHCMAYVAVDVDDAPVPPRCSTTSRSDTVVCWSISSHTICIIGKTEDTDTYMLRVASSSRSWGTGRVASPRAPQCSSMRQQRLREGYSWNGRSDYCTLKCVHPMERLRQITICIYLADSHAPHTPRTRRTIHAHINEK